MPSRYHNLLSSSRYGHGQVRYGDVSFGPASCSNLMGKPGLLVLVLVLVLVLLVLLG